ncbi:MAG TPA: hypothetical protein VG537_11660 [Candidatus Kapabacteria bacterium]|jgi:hypothetical protein|nr:hypothetical protein [Candidatus Kapabacteria bacterium]
MYKMRGPFIKEHWQEFRYTALSACAIAVVAYGIIAGVVLAIPHLPLASKRTFYALLRAQMAVDEGEILPAENRKMVLFLGSSVVERGVSEIYMDSVFTQYGIPFETMNAGTGGFCAEANLPMFRAMLRQGLRPSYVVYGVGIQELNGASTAHATIAAQDTDAIKLRAKTLWNIIQYGPTALSPFFDPDHLHQYLFAANNAFRDVPNLGLFDRLMFGQNAPPADSIYRFEQKYFDDLRSIVQICKDNGIAIALYNAPLRARQDATTEEPYSHRGENYRSVLALAREFNIPLWNFDRTGVFQRNEFQDNYHLTPIGAHRISGMLADSIASWHHGTIVRDGLETFKE